MAVLEICVDSLEGLRIAEKNGADRIELCSALSLGGLSPSYSLLRAAQSSEIPVNVMVRPRPGDFSYSNREIEGIVEEINLVRRMHLAGVVVGAGNTDGLDYGSLKIICDAAKGLDITVHRVVDLLPERLSLLQILSELGVQRILTSAGSKNVADNLSEIAKLIERAPRDLTIMPGSGVTTQNIRHILSDTGATEIHASAGTSLGPSHQKAVDLGFEFPVTNKTDGKIIQQMKEICRTFGNVAGSLPDNV